MINQTITQSFNSTQSKKQSEGVVEVLIFLSSAMDSMKNILPKNIELVLHDLTHPESSILKIINGNVTCRANGDPLLSAPDENDGFAGMLLKNRDRYSPFVLSGYNCKLKSGESIKSGSATYYDNNGKPIAAFAVNMSG